MASVWLNRLLLLLASAGIFVAGFLTYSYLNHLKIPCGTKSGCDFVATTPFAWWGPIPTPAFGLLGYGLLFLLAGLRTFAPNEVGKKTIPLGFVISLVGAVVSGYLMHTLYNVLRTSCEWCLISAALMIGTCIVYSFLASQEWERPAKPVTDQILAAVLVVVAASAAGVRSAGLTKMDIKKMSSEWTVASLKIPDYRFIGSRDAPISIIEVADYNCDACRANANYLHELEARFHEKVGLGFIHLPIKKEGHEMSGLMAVAAEIAGEKGKFWEFSEKLFSPAGKDIKDAEGVFAVLSSVGFDQEEVAKRLANQKDTAYDRFSGSFEAIRKIGIDRTPAFIIMWKDGGGLVLDKEGLEQALMSPETARVLEVDHSGHSH